MVSFAAPLGHHHRGRAVDGLRPVADKVRAYSRHKGINTLLTYIDDRDRDRNQRSLADVVAGTLTERL